MKLSDVVVPEPWPHQEQAFEFLHGREYGGLFADMGTGKSLVAVGLIVETISDDTLIVCPKAMLGTWMRTLREVPVVNLSPVLLDGPIKDRVTALQDENPHVYVTNYEAFVSDEFYTAVLRKELHGLILDESHRIKTPSSQTTKKLTALGKTVPHRYILTGTPAADSPLDVFAQLRFLSGSIVGTTWTAFRSRYAVVEQGRTAAGMFYPIIKGYQNQEELNRVIYANAFRVTNEVLSLPDTHDVPIVLRFDPKQRRDYDRMVKDSLLAVESEEVSAPNVLTRLLRLQEITSGYMQPDTVPGEERPAHVELNTVKQDALESLLSDIGHEPVVVFYKFKEDARRIHHVCGKSGRPWFQLNGDRNELEGFDAEPNDRGPVIAVQIAAGGAGVDLTKASKVVYYSNSYSLTQYEQSRARCHRPGQTKPVSYFHLLVEDTVDETVLSALRTKQVSTSYLIDGLRSQLAGDT